MNIISSKLHKAFHENDKTDDIEIIRLKTDITQIKKYLKFLIWLNIITFCIIFALLLDMLF